MPSTIYSNLHPSELKIKTKTLKARKRKLVERPTFSQNLAEKIVRKIAYNYFGFNVQSERIFKPYIIDIYIKPLQVGIEIDGGIHKKQGGYDNNRDEYLKEHYGVKIYRFNNEEITREYFKECIWSICLSGIRDRLLKIREKAIKHKMEAIINTMYHSSFYLNDVK